MADGNCFMHCIIEQEERLSVEDPSRDHFQLRSELVSFIKQLPPSDPLSEHCTDVYTQELAKPGIFVDAVAVQAMARMKKRDILIVTSLELSTQQGYLVNELSSGHPTDDPFILGLLGEEHYVSVEPQSDETLSLIHSQLAAQQAGATSSSRAEPQLGQEQNPTPEDSDSTPCEEQQQTSQDGDAGGTDQPFASTGSRSTRPCNNFCCKDAALPHQPRGGSHLLKTSKTYKYGNRTQERMFLARWYDEWPWIHLCTTTYKAYCFFCMKYKPRNSGLKLEPAFTTAGFNNWKKAAEKFEAHKNSTTHLTAVYEDQRERSKCGNSVHDLVLSQSEQLKQTRRCTFLNLLKSIKFLLRQGLPLRGHKEEQGNLRQLLSVCFEEPNSLENKYMSPTIVNELIRDIAHTVLRSVLSEIRKAKWFSLLADETRDVANREQLVVCIRWVSENYDVFEEPVGLVELPNTTAETIFNALKDCLVRLSLPMTACRGQAYDGARNFQGHVQGVATRIAKEQPAALSVHCLAHCINLCVQDAARKIGPIRDALDLSMEIIQLIKMSPKRQVLFEQIKNAEGRCGTGIKPLCPTRWTVRAAAMKAILDNYGTLQEVLEEVSQGSDEYARKAAGLLALMEKFSTLFGLRLSHLVFSTTDRLSAALQKKSATCEDSQMAANVCLQVLSDLRKDEDFTAFYEDCQAAGKDVCGPPALPRFRRPPQRVDDGRADTAHQFAHPTDFFRQIYFESLDFVSCEIQGRLKQKNLQIVKDIEDILKKSARGVPMEISPEIKSLYAEDIDMRQLEAQLTMLPSAQHFKDKGTAEQVASIADITQLMNEEPILKTMLCEVDKLLKLYMTVPVTTATAERTFSALKRVKTYLRSTMTQERLNHCLLTTVYKEQTDLIDIKLIAARFTARSEVRQKYFGCFD